MKRWAAWNTGDTSFSFVEKDSGQETFVTVPELGGGTVVLQKRPLPDQFPFKLGSFHFVTMLGFLAFLAVHVTLIVLTGFVRNMNHICVGYGR